VVVGMAGLRGAQGWYLRRYPAGSGQNRLHPGATALMSAHRPA
jgi:hypothetical protein